MHRRLRWGNVARTAGVVALAAVVVAWPRLAPREPDLPGSDVAPVTKEPPAGDDEMTQRPERGWAHPNRAPGASAARGRCTAGDKTRAPGPPDTQGPRTGSGGGRRLESAGQG
jgi:hypothetical protein